MDARAGGDPPEVERTRVRATHAEYGVVRIDGSGRVEGVETRTGVELVGNLGPMVDYLTAFARSDLRHLRFVWIDDAKTWHAIYASREAGPRRLGRAGSTRVEIERTRPPYGLTVRELDVLTLLCGGLSNPEIASHLATSPRTTSTHVSRVLDKLGQTSRAGAAAIAVEQGLLRVPVPGSGRALGVLGVGLIDQLATGLTPSPPGPTRWRQVLRFRSSPIRIGLVAEQTPYRDGDGTEQRNGAALAIAELNRRGGVDRRPLAQVVVEVDAGDAAGYRAALSRLLELDVDAVLGGYCHYATPETYGAVREHGCPVLTTMTSEAQAVWVREDPSGLGHVFQVGPTEVNYGTGMIAFLNDLSTRHASVLRGRRVLPIQTPVDSGDPFGPRAREHAGRSGWDVQDPILVPLHGVDWEPVLRRVIAVDPSVVVLTHFAAEEAAAFQRAYVEAGVEALVYMVYAPSVPAFGRLAGAAAEGVVWSTVTGTYSDPLGVAFERRYAQAYGAVPGRSLAGSHFDQVQLLALAWARVADTRRFAAVAAELRRIRYRGVNGSYAFATPDQTVRSYPLETSDPSLGAAHLVFQIQGGAHRALHPAPYADAPFRRPAWVPIARARG